jgi:hypothetical protein
MSQQESPTQMETITAAAAVANSAVQLCRVSDVDACWAILRADPIGSRGQKPTRVQEAARDAVISAYIKAGEHLQMRVDAGRIIIKSARQIARELTFAGGGSKVSYGSVLLMMMKLDPAAYVDMTANKAKLREGNQRMREERHQSKQADMSMGKVFPV